MFFYRQKKTKSCHHETEIPCIRVSICTGEETAGFRDKDTGRFKEVMLIQSEEDLEAFRKEYGIEETVIQNKEACACTGFFVLLWNDQRINASSVNPMPRARQVRDSLPES